MAASPRAGSLLVVCRSHGPVYYGKWRDSTGRQIKRRLGLAWVEQASDGWKRRRGWVPAGILDERAAFAAMSLAMEAHEERIERLSAAAAATFADADAAALWLRHAEHIKGLKPSTLADLHSYLCPVDAAARKRGRAPAARIMKAFGQRTLSSITTGDINRFLAELDTEPTIGPRTINKYR